MNFLTVIFPEFIEPLVVDYPPEIGDPDNSSSSPLQPQPDRLALHPKLEPGRLDTSQGSTGEGFTESGMETIFGSLRKTTFYSKNN